LGPYYLRDRFSISIYPFATKNSLFLISSYIIFGFFLSRYITNKSRIFIILIPIVLVSLLEAIIGFYQSFIVYGISHSQGAHGTFVNRNHYAGLLEITIPLILGFAFSMNKFWHTGFRNMLHSIKYSDDVFKQTSIMFLVFFLLLAVFLSKSRMGILSISISLFFFYSNLNLFGKNFKTILWFLTISIIFFLLLIFLIDINPILERFRNIDADQRVSVWKDCIQIIKDFPLFGSGLGTFKYIYPLYKENLKAAVDYHYAHNDYIHLLVETGAIGFSCLMIGLIILFKDAVKFLKYNTKTKDSFGFFITLGAFSGVVSILVHGLADFNLHIPSNALYFTTMIGIIYGINSKSEDKKRNISGLEKKVVK
jgi:O-antigen ligase